MGRRAARILAAEWPTLFQYDEDEPHLDVFRPQNELNPRNAGLTEGNLRKLLDDRKVGDAVVLFERMSSESHEVSKELQVI